MAGAAGCIVIGPTRVPKATTPSALWNDLQSWADSRDESRFMLVVLDRGDSRRHREAVNGASMVPADLLQKWPHAAKGKLQKPKLTHSIVRAECEGAHAVVRIHAPALDRAKLATWNTRRPRRPVVAACFTRCSAICFLWFGLHLGQVEVYLRTACTASKPRADPSAAKQGGPEERCCHNRVVAEQVRTAAMQLR